MRKNIFLAALIALTAFGEEGRAAVYAIGDTTYYNYVNSGKVVGQEWVYRPAANDYYFFDQYNDRGRGPLIRGHIKTDEKGFISFAEYKGVDYMKSPVDESFEVRNGRAFWRNKFENDSAAYDHQLYSTINGTLAEYGLILQMLKKQASGELRVLPGGVRNFKKVTTTTILDSVTGRSVPLQLISFSGYGGTPVYLWFHENGDFFALAGDWFSLVEKGYEGHTKALATIQHGFEATYFNELASRLTDKSTINLAIKNVTLFDAKTGLTKPDQTVLVHGDHIYQVGPAKTIGIPSIFKIIDGKGKFLMPGLWEMHGHFGKESGPFMLAQGVTNLRDMGNGPELLRMREQIRKDSLLGPDVTVISGFIDKAGEFAAPTGVLINSLDEGLKAIQDYKDKGYDQIKLYSSIEPAWVKPLAAKSHQLGMRVCGHIPAYMTASQAIDAGYDEVTHVNMLVLNFFGDTIDTRSMGRFFIPGKKGYTIDVQGDAVQTLIKKLQDRHIVLDPTLGVFEEMYIDLPGRVSKKYAPIAAYLPAEVKRSAMAGGYIDGDSLVSVYDRSFNNMLKLIKEIYDKKITILTGTDGGILERELELYAQAGIPNAEVLRLATWWPATVSGKTAQLGTIEPGKIANMILVDGDPLSSIGDMRKIYLTVRDGKCFWPKDIYKSFGWGYYY